MRNCCVFVFRRDLRLCDNTALMQTLTEKNANVVVPIFILNDAQLDPKQNPYHSKNAVRFMIESLHSLDDQLRHAGSRLLVFHAGAGGESAGEKETLQKIVAALETAHGLRTTCIASNADITPYARRRDEALRAWAASAGIRAVSVEGDYTMHQLGAAKTNKGTAFEVFTPYYRKAMRMDVASPTPFVPKAASLALFDGGRARTPGELTRSDMDAFVAPRTAAQAAASSATGGGRERALKILDAIRLNRKAVCGAYEAHHDFPAREATTRLGAYLKFGCVSVREAYAAVKQGCGRQSKLMEQLFWREFYYNVAHAFPETLAGQVGGRNAFVRHRYERARWNERADDLRRWKEGRTGVPFVDAAMRCLAETGWLHNRARMVVAMFLVRDLEIDWRLGERHFATCLVDYDPVNNNQGWCWALSYRRKLSPFRQAERFDPKCEFIRRWVPELRDVPDADVFAWPTRYEKYTKQTAYPPPMMSKKRNPPSAKKQT